MNIVIFLEMFLKNSQSMNYDRYVQQLVHMCCFIWASTWAKEGGSHGIWRLFFKHFKAVPLGDPIAPDDNLSLLKWVESSDVPSSSFAPFCWS